MMIDRVIELRNRIHENDFRLVLTPEHWNALYVPQSEKTYFLTVSRDEELVGYVAFCTVDFGEVRAYDVREICAADESTMAELIDQMIDRSVRDKIDFVFLKTCEEPYNKLLRERGFSSFIESAIMIALLDPRALLLALSEPVDDGPVLKVTISGFDPVLVRVGAGGIALVADKEPDLTISTNSKTWVRLFFGRTSFLRELLRGSITASSLRNLRAASRLFRIVRQNRWYIPMADSV